MDGWQNKYIEYAERVGLLDQREYVNFDIIIYHIPSIIVININNNTWILGGLIEVFCNVANLFDLNLD